MRLTFQTERERDSDGFLTATTTVDFTGKVREFERLVERLPGFAESAMVREVTRICVAATDTDKEK